MELTPEERRKIYEEEKARLESSHVQLSVAPPKQNSTKWIVIVVVIIAGYLFFRLYDSGTKSVNPSNVNSNTISSSNSQSTSALPVTSTPTSAYDPVNDRSEEGIRQNILAADENKSITYEHLKKNADKYDGEPWAFTGKVFQIQESGEQTMALVSLDAWGNKLMQVKANFSTDFVEKDQVYVVGYLDGNYSYTSIAGWNMTIPSIAARGILKPNEVAKARGSKGAKK